MNSRVLFVDDEKRLLDGLRRALARSRKDWEMTFLTSPTEAIAAYRHRPFDVVVSDITMPEMTGLTMVREMQKLEQGGGTAFVILSGTADLNAAVSAINDCEVFRFFTKPCAANLLAEGIEAALFEIRRRMPVTDDLTARLGMAALNRLHLGIIVVDQSGQVLFANQAGSVLLAEKDGMRLGQDGLCRTAEPTETARLHRLIFDCCAGGAQDSDQAAIALSRPSNHRALTVIVTALEIEKEERTLAALLISDPEVTPLPSIEALKALFGLSTSEARLVRALVDGANLHEAAEVCSVTISTARTYLKQAFAKTGTGSQSELLKLILTTPAIPTASPVTTP